jgi:hypothetical protein
MRKEGPMNLKTQPTTELVATVQRAAEILRVSDYLIRRGIRKGQIETVQIGDRTLVKVPSLLRMVGAA